MSKIRNLVLKIQETTGKTPEEITIKDIKECNG